MPDLSIAVVVRALLSLATVALLGCGSAPVPGLAGEQPDGEPVVIRLRGDGFVELGGARVPFEDMVYDLRRLCRTAAAADESPPWLVVIAPAGLDDLPEVIDRLRAAAYDAGVRHIDLRAEGA